MIDVSFYCNYFISGLSPRGFYVFNVAVHIINALLLFRFTAGLNMFSKKDQYIFALAAGFLFLIYPFHNESIAWLSGRLSSMACFFALFILLLAGETGGSRGVFLSILCYLTGLLCYESIIVLPAIVMVLNWQRYKAAKKNILFGLYWICAVCGYLLARFFLSGGITGDYGSRVTQEPLQQKIIQSLKVLGRLFFPPSDNQSLLTALVIILFILLIAIHLYVFYHKMAVSFKSNYYRSLLICLAISLSIPFAFGVSTHTSEGDRLLYFPSCFLCIIVAGWIIILYKSSLSRFLVLAVIGIYSVWLLEKNNQYWVKASVAAKSIMEAVKKRGLYTVVFINMPDELEGAFIFRNGFMKALAVNHIDTNVVKVFSYLQRPDYLKVAGNIVPATKNDTLNIFPATGIYTVEGRFIHLTNRLNNETWVLEKERNLIYYWNKENLVKVYQ
ncbi:MAG: hypothetical protein ABIQ88_13630 [Chitinophagaceae bacterium]